MKFRIVQKLNVLIISVTLIIVSIFAWYVLYNVSDKVKQRINEQLMLTAAYQKTYMDYFFSTTIKELNLITSRTYFRESLLLYKKTGNKAYLEHMDQILRDANAATNTFESLTLTTTKGDILFTNDPLDQSLDCKANLEQYKDISKIYIPMSFGKKEKITKPYMRMRAPVMKDGTTVALLYAKINLIPLNELSALRKNMEYKTADTVVVYYREKDALFLTPVKYDEDAALKRTIQLENQEISYNQARNYPEGKFIKGLDYRGLDVYSYVLYMDKYNIGLSVELDLSEFQEIQSKKVGLSLLMLTSLLLLAAVFTIVLTRKLLQPLQILHSVIVHQSKNTEKLMQVENITNDEFGELAHSYNQMIQQVQKQSITDELTQLHNRKAFRERMAELIAQYKRYNLPFTMLMLDIDHFKQINDTYGHQVGDKVLIALSEELKSHARKNDYVFRFGGEEFVILLTGTKMNDAVMMAEKIRVSMQKNINIIDNREVTVSIGVAEFGEDDTHDTLVKRADDNLYCAKERGRNSVCSQE